jgi:hypothetical protein
VTPAERRDFRSIRYGLGACAGPDRVVALDALARVEARFMALSEHASRVMRSEDDTKRTSVPGDER